MKSSDRKQGRSLYLSNDPIYSLLAIYMPLTTLAAVLFLTETFLYVKLPSAQLIGSSGIGALAASLYCDFMNDSKASRTAADIRGGIIITAVTYFLNSVFRTGIPLIQRFLPDDINILASAGALFIWAAVVSFKQIFSARRRFEIVTELYHGEKLQEVLVEDSGLLQFTTENIEKAWKKYFYQLILVGVLALFCAIFRREIPGTLYFLLVVIFFGGVCIYGFFEIIKWEHYYAGEGISISVYDRNKRIPAMAAFSLLCLIAALLFASDKTLLPVSIITGFLSWIASLIRRFNISIGQMEIAENPSMNMDLYPEMFPLEDANYPPFWAIFSRYFSIFLRYSLIAFAAAVFIWFMISPLFNRGNVSGKLTFIQKLFRIITEWFRSVLAAISSFIIDLKSSRKSFKLRKYNAGEINRTAESLFGAYSAAKKRNIRRSVTLFAQLIIWGGEVRKVIWRPSLAPGEYCEILAAASSAIETDETGINTALLRQNEGIIRCGGLFEKALYSAEVLTDAEQKEFKTLVEEITSAESF